ncbi:hypothetical protein VTN96DRAFT_7269 [Rasamsonia emersonii]
MDVACISTSGTRAGRPYRDEYRRPGSCSVQDPCQLSWNLEGCRVRNQSQRSRQHNVPPPGCEPSTAGERKSRPPALDTQRFVSPGLAVASSFFDIILSLLLLMDFIHSLLKLTCMLYNCSTIDSAFYRKTEMLFGLDFYSRIWILGYTYMIMKIMTMLLRN